MKANPYILYHDQRRLHSKGGVGLFSLESYMQHEQNNSRESFSILRSVCWDDSKPASSLIPMPSYVFNAMLHSCIEVDHAFLPIEVGY